MATSTETASPPVQNDGSTLAFFNPTGLPVGLDSVGLMLPAGLTAADLGFSYTPIGQPTVVVPVTVLVPEPSTIAMLVVLGFISVFWRRRRA